MTDIRAPLPPEVLVRARQEIADNPELRGLFSDPPDRDWLADNLAVRLSARWGGKDFGTAWEASLYLADEYFQNRATPIVVADRTTGEAIAHLPAEAVWQPAPVPRESGNLVQPLPRLRPDVEAALVVAHHDQARERAELARRAELGSRVRDTSILTARGRDNILQRAFEAAREEFAGKLQERLHGAVSLGRGTQPLTLVATPSIRMPDLSSMNLAFSFETWLTRALSQHWTRAVAATLVERAERESLEPWVWVGRTFDATTPVLWIGNPEQLQWVREQAGYGSTFQWDERLIGVRGVGLAVEIDLNAAGAAITAEMAHDTWQVAANLPVRVTRLDGEIAGFDVTVPREHRAEVVR